VEDNGESKYCLLRMSGEGVMNIILVQVAGGNELRRGRRSCSAADIYAIPSESLPFLRANTISLRVHGLELCSNSSRHSLRCDVVVR
jgi:hypothetical protein